MDEKKKRNIRLWLYFSGVVFCSVLLIIAIILLIWYIYYELGIASVNPFQQRISLIPILSISLLVGGLISLAIGRTLIKPIRKLGDAFEELSNGNFDVQVPTDGKLADVRKMAERFNAMTYDLSHVETLRTDFVANVSHEFKTPIAAIEGYATLLQNPALTQEKHDYYVYKILNNTRRLTNLSSNILMLSRLENQDTILHTKEYMLDEQLRKAVLLLEEKWSVKNLGFDIELENQPFSGDENLLDQVWYNLLDNAIKHSHENGTIKVTITPQIDVITVTISDNGDGMSEDTKKHIFEKFYQGDSSHKSEGNGLGLALVKRIVDLCHGSIRVQSEIGNGTTFAVTLPTE